MRGEEEEEGGYNAAWCRLVLLNRMLEEGNTVYRAGDLDTAAATYTAALDRMGGAGRGARPGPASAPASSSTSAAPSGGEAAPARPWPPPPRCSPRIPSVPRRW